MKYHALTVDHFTCNIATAEGKEKLNFAIVIFQLAFFVK